MPYTTLEKDGSAKTGLIHRIRGFSIITTSGDKTEFYFKDLDEAVTEELTLRFIDKYFTSDSLLVQDDYFTKIMNMMGEKNTQPIRFDLGLTDAETYVMMTSAGSTYDRERTELWKLILNVKEKNSDKFESPEDIFNIFAKKYFTGNALALARLIEKIYGKDSFRKLGEKTKAK